MWRMLRDNWWDRLLQGVVIGEIVTHPVAARSDSSGFRLQEGPFNDRRPLHDFRLNQDELPPPSGTFCPADMANLTHRYTVSPKGTGWWVAFPSRGMLG